MLFECSCEATQELLQAANEGGFALRPKANTPLAELVRTTTVGSVSDMTAALGAELKVIPIEQMAEESNNPLHNGWVDEVAARAGAIVNRRLANIRESVIPVISGISTSVMEAVKFVPSGPVLQNIERYVACDMINVPDFMNKVQKDTPMSYLDPDVWFREEPKSQAQLMEFLKLGSQTLDTALGVAINHIGADNLWLLWDSLFVDRAQCTAENYMTFDQAVMNSAWGLDYSILIYVMADLLKDKDAQASKQYREAAAYWLSRHTKNYNDEIQNKRLIRQRVNERGAIVVNGAVYVEFLQRQGTAEMVIGAAVGDNRLLTVDDILGNSEKVLKAYTVQKSSSYVENSLKLTEAFRKAFHSAFMMSFKNERSEAEKGYFEKYPGDESAVVQKFEDMLPLISANAAEDIYRLVGKVLCQTRFFYMDCECFLDAVDAGCKAGLSPEEAQVQATLREISKYVTSQVTC